MLALVLYAVFPAVQGTGPAPRLEIGKTIESQVEAGDPFVETERLKNYADAPVVGKRFTLELSEPGTYTLDLHSSFFDAYLVLRDAQGSVLQEDDDGLIGTHSRIVLEATGTSRSFLVDACALHGARGRCKLSLVRGGPEVLGPDERKRRAIEDARAGLQEVEAEKGPDHPDTVASILQFASMLEAMESLAEAREFFERALAIQERIAGPEHPDTATTLNRLGWVLRNMGRYREARSMFERALAIREGVLGPESAGTAAILDNLGLVHQDMGEYAQARPLYERGLAIREKVLGPESPYTAWSLNNLGSLFHHLGSYGEARPYYERALAIQEKTLGRYDADTGRSYNNLAVVLQGLGRYAEARPLYERAIEIREKVRGPWHSDTAQSLSCLASLLQAMGNYREARPLYERALAIDEKGPGPEHPYTATSLSSLASLLKEMGSYSEAQPLYERALAIREKVLGPDHPATANSLSNLASLFMYQGNYSSARPLLERALAIHTRAEGPDQLSTATAANNLAVLLRYLGKLEEAQPLFERALEGREKALGPMNPETATSLRNLALVLQGLGRTAEARPLLERALAIVETAFGADHLDTAMHRNSLAHVLADLGEEKPAWDMAIAAFDGTIQSLRSIFPALDEPERVNLCSRVFENLEGALTLEPRSPDPSVVRRTYESVLTWKGQVTRNALEDRERTLRSLPPEKRAEVQELRDVQSEISTELSRTSAIDPEMRERRLAELRERRSALERGLHGTSDPGNPTAPSLATLVSRMPEDSVLVDFLVHGTYVPAIAEQGRTTRIGRWTDPHVTAWIVSGGSDSIERVALGEAKPIREAIEGLYALLQGERGVGVPPADGVDALRKANERVRRLLWTPIAGRVGTANRIFLSPDRFLGTFPFEVLLDEDDRYLVEKFSISYVSDGATLASILGSKPVAAGPLEGSLLDVGGIDYDARGVGGSGRTEGEVLTASAVRGSFQDFWEPLRFTRKEAETVLALHESGTKHAGQPSRLLLGSDAVEEVLKHEVAGKRFIHIATHGFFQPEGLPSMWEKAHEKAEKPGSAMSGEAERVTGLLPGLLSGLVCAGANLPAEKGRDDGLLTAEEVTWLDLTQCDLLVLSACETALGKDRAGEGMMSLQRAFQMAGAKSVVASLWKVDDERTVDLMRSFYKHLWLEGRSRIDALREAQLEMLQRNRAERKGRGLPSSWGAFVLYGDWR